MPNLKKIIRYATDSDYRFIINSIRGKYVHLSDEDFLKKKYSAVFHRELDLDDPKTFNEKLQWLKLYDRRSIYTEMVDKYAAKKYVADIIGEEYIIPTLGVWDSFDDIDFDSLPDQFVLKCTHDSGGLVICKDKKKFNKGAAKKKIEKALKRDFYLLSREWPYKNVPRRIIAEKYLEDNTVYELRDYKFMCFNGEVKCSFVCSDRFTEKGLHVTFFDKDWNVMPLRRVYPQRNDGISKPENYDKMIEIAKKLSQKIPFARIDLYEVNGLIYFSEITLYPGAGYEPFDPEEWDYTFGSWIDLPPKSERE